MTTKAKKSTTKAKNTTAVPKDTKHALVCANGEQCFWTTDGKIISNIVELSDALETMTGDVFTHHVTKEKNDFANWIESVLNDRELAKNLRTAKKPNTARAIIVRRLKVYNF